MSFDAEVRRSKIARSLAGAAALWAMVAGALVLVGWAFDVALLKSVVPGAVTMKPNTALGFILAGAALWSARPKAAGRRARLVATACAAAVTLIGLLTLLEYLGWPLNLDQFLFTESPSATGAFIPGRMAPASALSFLLLGCALLLDRSESTAFGSVLVSPLIHTVLGISYITLVGHVYGVASFYQVSNLTPTAIHTAGTFALLAAGLLCAHPDRGLVSLLTSSTFGGAAARRLLPAAVCAPVLLGWLRLLGQRYGLYDTEFGVALITLANSGGATLIIWWTARTLRTREIAEAAMRRIAGSALANSEERFRATFEQMAVGIAHVDLDGRFLRVNQRYADIVGRTRDELKACTFQQITCPEDLGDDLAHVQRLVAGDISDYSIEKRYVRKDLSLVWVNLTASLVRDDAGTPTYFIAVVEEISARKRAEEEVRTLNACLEQRVHDRTAQFEAANKELEAFSYSVSHDLRAPLRAIDGYGRILLEDYESRLDPEGRRVLGVISNETQRMGQLIDDLLDFSRLGRQSLQGSTINLMALVQAIFEEHAAQLPQRHLQLELMPLPPVHGDRAMLRVVFNNLISNAIKFTRHRDPAVIEVGSRHEDGHVAYYVKDNGVGFDMTYAPKLFGVFQRLHSADEFEGTGVGLALVQRVIHRHGGRVWAEGRVNEGATFYFSLPHIKETS